MGLSLLGLQDYICDIVKEPTKEGASFLEGLPFPAGPRIYPRTTIPDLQLEGPIEANPCVGGSENML